MVTIQAAADILETSIVTARKRLGKPDAVETTKYNRSRFLYARHRVCEIAAQESACRIKSGEMCRICRERHSQAEMVGGRCNQCRANLCLMNFCCHNCLNCEKFDKTLLQCMKNAVEAIEHGK